MLTIYKPGGHPVRGLRTSLKGAQLPDGYFQAISNLRWDSGALTVRNGVQTVSSSAPGTVCLGTWSGSINGTYYVVSAWLISDRIGIYSLNLSTGAFTEITDAGNVSHPSTWSGDTTGRTRIGTRTTITAATNATPIVITASQHGLNDGDAIVILSVGGNTAANGSFFAKKISSTQFSLYSDPTLQTPVAGNGAYTSGGTVCRNHSVTFSSHTVPRRVISSIVYPPVDVLTINAFEEYPLVWNPAQDTSTGPGIVLHKNIIVPTGGTQFDYYATFSAHMPVAHTPPYTILSTSGTRYFLNDATPAPYTGANSCISLTATGTAATNDTSYINFGAPTSFPGEQINFIVEGLPPAVNDLFINCAIDFSLTTSFSSSTTIYDVSSADTSLTLPPIITPLDTGMNRYMITYSLKNVPTGSRSFQYMQFTRRNGSPGSSYAALILAIAGAGNGSGYYGDSEWQIAYSDHYSFAESGGITGTNKGSELLKNIGGPALVTGANAPAAGTKIVVDPNVLYDYNFRIKNVTSGQVLGGLNGVPAHVDFYFRTAAESATEADFLYMGTTKIYAPVVNGSGDHVWYIANVLAAGGTPGGTPLQFMSLSTLMFSYGLQDRNLRDVGTPSPSAYNIAMPRALAVFTANQRTFAGGIKDTTDAYQFGDLYFSALGFPFRFAALQERETAASRLTFDGERIRAGVMTSAAANGASVVYIITDQTFNALGTAGGFVGSGYDATSLSTRVRISAHGTNEPYSVAERAGVIFYIDQEGQVIRFAGGAGQSISRNAVDDRSKSIPANRRGRVRTAFFKDRYYLAYTPAGGAKNTHILGWNEPLQEWEFDDTLPSTVVAQQIVRAFDQTQLGSGQRLLLFSDEGKVYAYEEGTAEPGSSIGPLVQLRTKEFQTADMNLFHFGVNQMMVDHHAQVSGTDVSLNVDCFYKPRGSQFRGTIDCTDSDSPTKQQAIRRDSKIRTEITATSQPENGWSGFLDFNGNLGSGKTLWRIESDVELLSKGAGER